MSLTFLPSGRQVFDTGRVQIGLRAAPLRRDPGINAEAIQKALLGPLRWPVVKPWGKPISWRVTDFIVALWSRT